MSLLIILNSEISICNRANFDRFAKQNVSWSEIFTVPIPIVDATIQLGFETYQSPSFETVTVHYRIAVLFRMQSNLGSIALIYHY